MDDEVVVALDETEVGQIEREMGGHLPASYLKELRVRNGGDIVFDAVAVDFENGWSDEEDGLHLPLQRLMPLTIGTFRSDVSVLREWGLEDRKMMFGEGEGTYLWYFDFEENASDPTVWCLDISTEVTHRVADSFDALLPRLEKRQGTHEVTTGLTAAEVFADYPTMDEIREIIQGDDEDERYTAYVMWLTRCEDLGGLVLALRRSVERSVDEDELDSYAELLANVLINYTDGEFMTIDEAIVLFDGKEDISDLSHVIALLESEV